MQNLGKLEEFRQEAEEFILNHWEDAGRKVIEKCHDVIPYGGTFAEFLDYECTTCWGSDPGKWVLSGLKQVFPEVYDAIPNDMGIFAWNCLLYTTLLCGVDTSAE